MVKGNPKSSATSGTRKKHLKKNAPAEEPPPKEKRSKKGERGQKNAPRVKIYVPPVKPAPVQPDPLETTGLAHTLPADLLVILRNISKKAQVTKARALEELQAAWVNQCLKEGRESLLVYTLVEMLPVWVSFSAICLMGDRFHRPLASPLFRALGQFFASRSTFSRVIALFSVAYPTCSRAIHHLPSRHCVSISSGKHLGDLVPCNI